MDSFGSWLFTIARNEVSSHWRKEKPAVKAAQEAAWETEIHYQPRGPEDALLHKERLTAISDQELEGKVKEHLPELYAKFKG